MGRVVMSVVADENELRKTISLLLDVSTTPKRYSNVVACSVGFQSLVVKLNLVINNAPFGGDAWIEPLIGVTMEQSFPT